MDSQTYDMVKSLCRAREPHAGDWTLLPTPLHDLLSSYRDGEIDSAMWAQDAERNTKTAQTILGWDSPTREREARSSLRAASAAEKKAEKATRQMQRSERELLKALGLQE